MKNNRVKLSSIKNITFSAFTVILLLGGCYSYPAAQIATEKNIFSEKKKDHYSKALAKITILSLVKAQKVAVKNVKV